MTNEQFEKLIAVLKTISGAFSWIGFSILMSTMWYCCTIGMLHK